MKFPERFFRKIFNNSLDDHDLDVEIRCLHPLRSKDGLWPKQIWARNLEEMEKVWPEIKDLNERGYQVHFTVVPRLRKFQGKKEHPLPDKPIVSCLWGDLDVGEGKPYKTIAEALKRVQALEPWPNIIVLSGTGIHVYYLLEESRSVSSKRFDRLLKRLAKLLDGDEGAARATRLMRAPNTINWKSEAKKKTAVVRYLAKTRYHFRDLEAAWNTRGSDSTQHAGKPLKMLDGPITKPGRNVALASLAGAMRRRGATQETIVAALREENRQRVEPPLDDKEVEQIAASMSRYEPASFNVPYSIQDGHICAVRETKDGPVATALCNFLANVAEDITLDDGIETTRAFVIAGRLDTGEKLPAIRVPAARFPALNWVTENWGAPAIVNAGFSKRDQLREAIQRLSPTPRRRTVLTHTGWREVDGQWIFVTGGGAIGGKEIEVDLGKELQRYCLPASVQNPREAMRASLRLLNLAPLTVTIPLWAAMFRAPLIEMLPVDFSEWLEGQTGSFKSTLVALFLSHFGTFDAKSLPGTWESTVNQLEHRAFVLKDLPFVIDDYSPKPNLAYRDMEAKAARLLRAQGNLSGRGRLRADVTERPSHPPRGIIISTGEQHPPGQSLLARTLLLHVDRKMVDLPALSIAQHDSLLLPQAMSGYINWLAPWIQNSRSILSQIFAQKREEATNYGHKRIPEVLAHLYVGVFVGTWFAEVIGACSHIESVELRGDAWCALLELRDTQLRAVEVERPTRRFIQVILTLLTQNRVRLCRRTDLDPDVNDKRQLIGWYDDKSIYLLPEAAYEAVSRFCRECGELFTLRQERLNREFHDEGLSERDRDHFTVPKRLGRRTRRVICLHRAKVESLVGEQFPCDEEYDEDVEKVVTSLTGTGGKAAKMAIDGQDSAEETNMVLHKKPVKPVIRRFPRLPLRFPRLPKLSKNT